MSHPTLFFYPRPRVDVAEVPALAHAGAVLLTDTIHATGLAASLREALDSWTKPLAEHHSSKVLLDLALTLAIGGEHASDADLLRCEPDLFGDVASAPTISRMLTTLAEDAPAVIEAISNARRAARERAWALAGEHSPAAGASAKSPLVIDLDATLINGPQREGAGQTHVQDAASGSTRCCAFPTTAARVTGEPIASICGRATPARTLLLTIDQGRARELRPARLARCRRGEEDSDRTDGAGGTKEFLRVDDQAAAGLLRGFTLPAHTPDLLEHIDEAQAWTPAYDTDTDGIREGAWVAELTGLLDLSGWPAGMRVIVRKERPHPGAQLRITDHEGMRITAFATNTPRGQLPVLELRHRRRARCEDRIRNAKDLGLMKFPLQGFAQNQIWCQIIQLRLRARRLDADHSSDRP